MTSYGLFEDLAWGADSESQHREASRRSIANAKHLAVRDFGAYLNGAADKIEFSERVSAIRSELGDLVLRTAGKGHYKEVLEHLAWNFDKKDDDDDSKDDKDSDDSDSKSDSDSDSDSSGDSDSDSSDSTPDFVDDDDDDDKSRKESALGPNPEWSDKFDYALNSPDPAADSAFTNPWNYDGEDDVEGSPHNEYGTTDDFNDYGTHGHGSGWYTPEDQAAYNAAGDRPREGEGLNDGFQNPKDTNNYPPTEPQPRRNAAAPSIYNPAGQTGQAGTGLQTDLTGAGADAVLDDSQVAPTRDQAAVPAATAPGVMAHVRKSDADWDELEDWPLENNVVQTDFEGNVNDRENSGVPLTASKLPRVPRNSGRHDAPGQVSPWDVDKPSWPYTPENQMDLFGEQQTGDEPEGWRSSEPYGQVDYNTGNDVATKGYSAPAGTKMDELTEVPTAVGLPVDQARAEVEKSFPETGAPGRHRSAGNPFAAPLKPIKNPANPVHDPEGVQTVHPSSALTPEAPQGNPFGRSLDDPLHPSNQYKAPISNIAAKTYPKVARGRR